MICLVLLMCCLGGALSSTRQWYYAAEDAENHFSEFMKTHDKHYSSEVEKQARFEIFKKNLEKANELNMAYSKNEPNFGITQFSDLTHDEFVSVTSCIKMPESRDLPDVRLNVTVGYAPDELDWRTQNMVSGVKAQRNCGSCWAFATAANIESQYAMKYRQLLDLSEQQLVDCDTQSHGCGGGYPSFAMASVVAAGGIMGETNYPYEAVQSQCRFNQAGVAAKLTGAKTIPVQSEDELKEILYSNGPISILVNALYWQQYTGGVLPICPVADINHAVLLVGYGVENGVKYWLIKNSWATTFGEAGYIKIKRGENACNLMGGSFDTALIA